MAPSLSTQDNRTQPWKMMGTITKHPLSEAQAIATEKQQAGVEGSKNLGEHPMKHMFIRLVFKQRSCTPPD